MKINKSFLKCVSMVLAVMFLTLLPGNALLSMGNHSSVWGSERINQFLQDDLTDMISSLRGEAYTIDLNEEDLVDFTILDPVSFLDLDFVSNNAPEVIHFPLADKNGRIFAVFSVGRSETGYGRNFGQSFSRILESARLAGSHEVFLYQKGWDLYALDPGTKQIHRLNDSPQARSSDKELEKKMHSTQHEYNHLCSTFSLLEKEDYIDNSIQLNEYNAEHTAKYTQSVRVLDSAPSAVYPKSKILTGVPLLPQTYNGIQRGICWAATIAAILRYEKPGTYSSITAQQIADKFMKDNGISDPKHKEAFLDTGLHASSSRAVLESYLGNPYRPQYLSRVLSRSEIEYAINNLDPAYISASGVRNGSSIGHAVVMYGYNYNTRPYVNIGDSAHMIRTRCDEESTGKWTFLFGGIYMTWQRSVWLQYA